MTQSDIGSPTTDDDTTSGESDSGSDKGDEDDSLTKQTRGERLLQVAQEAIEAEESENDARTRGDGLQRAPTQPPRPGREAPQPPSGAPRAAWEGPTTTRQRPPAAQRNSRGLGLDRGEAAWLNLEQVASIIQLHNTPGRSILTTLLQGTEREDGDTVWTHMREAERAAAEETGRPTTRLGDWLMR